jgi:hypothetical protein
MSPTDTLPSFAQPDTAAYVYRQIALASGPERRFVTVPKVSGAELYADHIKLARDLVERGRLDEWVIWGYRAGGQHVVVDRQYRPGSGQSIHATAVGETP